MRSTNQGNLQKTRRHFYQIRLGMLYTSMNRCPCKKAVFFNNLWIVLALGLSRGHRGHEGLEAWLTHVVFKSHDNYFMC